MATTKAFAFSRFKKQTPKLSAWLPCNHELQKKHKMSTRLDVSGSTIRNSQPEVFLKKGFLKIFSKFTEEHPYRSEISIKLLCNFIEIALRHGCSPVNLLQLSNFVRLVDVPKNIWMILSWLPGDLCTIFRADIKLGSDLQHASKNLYSKEGLFRWMFCLCLSWFYTFWTKISRICKRDFSGVSKETSPILDFRTLTSNILHRRRKNLRQFV